MRARSWESARGGFLPGVGVGALVALFAMIVVDPSAAGAGEGEQLAAWIVLNLGHSSWLFAALLVLFVVHLLRLRQLLDSDPDQSAVVELDQLTDVWIHSFIGIGVIWTAVGMRGALQLALADPDHALADSAGSVLKKLVDGGILLALTTTIVGAVGGYLLRLGKTLYAGAALHEFYEGLQRRDTLELLATVRRIERSLDGSVERSLDRNGETGSGRATA
jgi:hypothetical protein